MAPRGHSVVELRLDGVRDVTVVPKCARRAEVVALRAVAEVLGMSRPRPLPAGADWVVLPYYGDTALGADDPVPDAVYDTLGRVHQHYLSRPPVGLPVVDGPFWPRLCRRLGSPATPRRVGGARLADHPGDQPGRVPPPGHTVDRVRRALAARTACEIDTMAV
jgi:hypothetical protein